MRLIGIVILWSMVAGLATGAGPAPTPPRIAIISGSDASDLATLLTAELSQNKDLQLLERNDLTKVGDEIQLQRLAGNDAVSLGKLVGADGLIFITKSPDGFQARFTATGLGYALFDDRFESATDLPHLTELIGQRVSDYAPKLKLRPEEAVPISILNLRSDVAETDSADVERKLTLLLESRFAAAPKYVVLERRHVSGIKFERTLSNSIQPVMPGVSVIDGSLTLPAQGKEDMTVQLRLRPSGGQPVPLEIHGSIKDLPALAESLVNAVGAKLNVTADATAWQPEKEAHEYLHEGIWGLQHNAEPAALEALDSAELLGQDLPDVIYARMPVLCGVAVGTSSVMTGDQKTPDDPHPDARVDAILRAFNDEARYENENMSAKLHDVQPDNSTIGNIQMRREGLARATASLLTMLDSTHYVRADEVRSAFANFVGYDPLHGKFPQDLFLAVRYVDSLSQTEEEEKAYYRVLLAFPADSLAWRLVNGSLYRDSYCAHFYPDDAYGHDHARYIAYLDFLKSLYDGPCRLNAQLQYADNIIPKDLRDAACDAFYQSLTDQRDSLMTTNQLAPYLGAAFDLERSRGVMEADPRIIALLHFLLQHVDTLNGHLSQAWVPDRFPPAEAPALWKEFQALEAKSTPSPYIDNMHRKYVDHFGVAVAPPGALEVNRFWYPPNALGKPNFTSASVIAVPDGVWLGADFIKNDTGQPVSTGTFYHVTLETSHPGPFSTETYRIPGFHPKNMVVTADSLYVIGFSSSDWKKSLLQRFDFSTQRFEVHDLPHARGIFEANDKIYLELCGIGIAEMEGGIALLNQKTCETTILASSRRRPAQNQFDDRTPYTVWTVFPGCGGKPWASMSGFGEIYSVEDQPGPWPRVIPSGGLIFSETQGSRTLLYGSPFSNRGETKSDTVFMIDSTKPNPELLLGAPGPLFGTGMVGKPEPLPPQPDWSQHPLWVQPSSTDPHYYSRYGFRGGDIFGFITQPKNRETDLFWYRHGQANPIQIPLSFKMSDEATVALKAMEDADDDPIKNMRPHYDALLEMVCGQQGLYFVAANKGFWFLPFSDIDAFLKTGHN